MRMRAVRLELLGDRVARTAAERACQDRRQGRVDRLRPLTVTREPGGVLLDDFVRLVDVSCFAW